MRLRTICLIALLLGCVAIAHAQSAPRIAGKVVTPDGEPLAGATVSIDQLGLSTTTDDEGVFVFEEIRAGSWEIVVTLAGELLLRDTVAVPLQQQHPLVLTLADLPRAVTATVTVRARADSMLETAMTASEGVVGQIDLQTRPLFRSGDLVETVPGVIATQHSGGGKANQYFLRGFNLDHGTDFAAHLDGVPINMPSHGHGQGYLDLSFLIPELVDTISFTKGFVSARDGDFAAAGTVDFSLRDRVDSNMIGFTVGEYGYARGLAMGSVRFAEGDLLGAIELFHDDGPWEVPGNFRRLNAVAKYTRGGPAAGIRVTALAYDANWDATDHIPLRAVESGALSRFGSVDDTSGGTSSRYSVAAEWWYGSSNSFTRINGYVVSYDLELYSNFTYALEDALRGDQFEQLDDRWIAGGEAQYQHDSRWKGIDVSNQIGFQLRQDWIDNGLFRTAARQRLSTVRTDSISLLSASPYVATTVLWNPWLRSSLGLRGDFYSTRVDSDDARNSGDARRSLASPKLTVALGPWSRTELYGSFGGGFHSNDARGATIAIDPVTGEPAERVPLLVRAWGWELGVRNEAVPGLNLAAALFALDLDSELVFVGDAGGTEASRPSRRRGIEITSFYAMRPWLRFDLDVAFTRARFDDEDPANRIPGALEKVITGGVAFDGWRQWSGALRVRYFGGFPLIENNSVRADSSTQVNGSLVYLFPLGIEIGVDVFNLLDAEASDIQYYYASRLPGEPVGGVDDVHFHPVQPRTFRILASWRR
jgi:hypothetical protein